MKLTRRDVLAKDRTHLANERTLLAYWRTALAFLVLGGFLVKFWLSSWSTGLAFVSMIFGIFLFIYGTAKYWRYERKISKT